VDVIQENHEIMTSIAASVEEQTATLNEISKTISGTSLFAETVSTSLKNAIKLEKDVSKKLNDMSHTARNIAKDAKDALGQTLHTRKNVADVSEACAATVADTRRIETQIQNLTHLYQVLHEIVIRFKIK
jgi:methyl-accepting chemotaxis protein